MGRMMKIAAAWVGAAGIAAAPLWDGQGVQGSHAASPTSGPPPGLSTEGRLLWNLEALMQKSFGSSTVCTWYSDPRTVWNFNDFCVPLADMILYTFTFDRPRGSAFHLGVPIRYAMVFGTRLPVSVPPPGPVLVAGRLVVCDAHGREFLTYRPERRTLTLQCLPPYPGRMPNGTRVAGTVYDRKGHSGVNLTTHWIKLADRDWALDWIYRCDRVLPPRERSLAIRVGLSYTRHTVGIFGGRGKHVAGEELFWYQGPIFLHIRSRTPMHHKSGCVWRVWVIAPHYPRHR
jgi:hypothetical protein